MTRSPRGQVRVDGSGQLPGQEPNNLQHSPQNTVSAAKRQQPGPKSGPFSAWIEDLAALLDACPEGLPDLTKAEILELAQRAECV